MRCAFTAVAALLPPAIVRGAAAQPECPDGSGMAEAESEQMQTDLVQTRAKIFGGRGAAAAHQRWRTPGSGAGGFDSPRTAGGGDPTAALTASLLRSQAGAELSAEERASLLVPVAWLHVSKTGTSFCNTLWHTPAVCPSFSADEYVDDSETQGSWNDAFGRKEEVCTGLSKSYKVRATDTGDVNGPDPGVGPQPYSHIGIGGLEGHFYLMNRGHFVTMLRQPEQRMISQYNHYGGLPMFVNNLQTREWPYGGPHPTLEEYALLNGGCTVRQLTREALVPCDSFPLPTSEDVSLATTVLREGFAFVGITEQWALSVCMFRVMFGGQCLKSDFVDTRPGEAYNGSDDGYDTSELKGWVDPWDGPLYAEALSMFESTRKVYGVDTSSCTALCGTP